MNFQELYLSLLESLIIKNFFTIFDGLDETLLLLLISLPIGFILSLIFALGRVSGKKFISKPISAYIFLVRGTPLLVQIYLIYFGLGSVKAVRDSFLWIILKEPFWCGVLALTINTVAYGSEIFRGGIQSVTKGQIESGKSLGFSIFELYRRIIFPIALRKVLPSYGNELILMVKATSLVSLTTYMEMTGIARKLMAKTFAPVEAFIAAGFIYLFLNFLMVQLIKYLEWKYNPHLRLKN
jgi:octopine/nopaline transport system permease protein